IDGIGSRTSADDSVPNNAQIFLMIQVDLQVTDADRTGIAALHNLAQLSVHIFEVFGPWLFVSDNLELSLFLDRAGARAVSEHSDNGITSIANPAMMAQDAAD